MAEKSNNLQDLFLNTVRKSRVPVTMFLVNGVKLQGVVTWFDNFCVLLRRDGHSQLVYKHAISTVMPASPLSLFEQETIEQWSIIIASTCSRLTDSITNNDQPTSPNRRKKKSALGWLDTAQSKTTQVVSAQRAIVIHPYGQQRHDSSKRNPEACLAEAVSLTAAIHIDVVAALSVPIRRATPAEPIADV